MPNPQNKIIFTSEQQQFMRANYLQLTNKELSVALGVNQTSMRKELYRLGLKKFIKQHWTDQQVEFLKVNYKVFGDTELAEIFDVKYYKVGGWSKKHIEKKRRYLKLKRTTAEIKQIYKRNTLMGRFSQCAKKRWETIGQAPIGEKRIWFNHLNAPFVVIKTKSGFVHYNRWLWEKHKGKIPAGMNVRIMIDDKINYSITDLQLFTNAENAVLNSRNRTSPELKTTKELINKINRKIIQNEK